jgi:hypothetical protein
VWASIGIGLTLSTILILGAFWVFGLFDTGGSDSGAKIVAAVLALVGVFITQAVVVVGFALKDSIDKRSQALRQQELSALEAERIRSEERSIREAHRNRVDISIRAVDLIGFDAALSNQHQVGGALLTLANLDEMGLALALAVDLWSSGGISDVVGLELVRKGLGEGQTENVHQEASVLLYRNAHKIRVDDETTNWPLYEANMWPRRLSDQVRYHLAMCAATWFRDDMMAPLMDVSASSRVLYEALNDSEPAVWEVAAATLRPLADFVSNNPGQDRIGGTWHIPVITQKLAELDYRQIESGPLVPILADIKAAIGADGSGAQDV